MIFPWRASRLATAALAAYASFAILLALVIARLVPVPVAAVVALASVGLALTVALVVRGVATIVGGPHGDRFDAAAAIRCSPEEARGLSARASRRDEAGGAGWARRWAAVFPVAAWTAAGAVLLSGLLNVTMRIEGTWIQWAGSGMDLDLRETYRSLDVGWLADPAELRYGVTIGEVRPGTPAQLADLSVVNASGQVVVAGPLAAGGANDLAGARLFTWGYGPGVHLTVMQKEQGRLLDAPVPLWPAGKVGSYAEQIENGPVRLELRVDGWPFPEGAPGGVHATLRNGAEVLFDGTLLPKQVEQAAQGYGLISWESRPWVGFGIAHRTFSTLSRWSLAALLVALLASVTIPARPFWYRHEPDGGVSISPPSAWAAIARRP